MINYKQKLSYSKLLRFLFDILVLVYLCIHLLVIRSNWGEGCVKTDVKSLPGDRRVAGEGGPERQSPRAAEFERPHVEYFE
jgi:hypothetical protein